MPCYDPYSTELYSESRTALAAPSRLTAINAAEQAFEREKAAITSYEQGWDRWDGPVWPLGYVQCRMQVDGYTESTTPATKSGPKPLEDRTR